jgi:hypothetical protein
MFRLPTELGNGGRLKAIWQRLEGLQPTVVWLGWAAFLVWVGVFVARHGHNLPACDEWAFVHITYASWSDRLDWLFESHMEHRFPLGRLVFLVLLDVTHHDFRAGMWLTVGLLSAAAAALILAARQLRGRTQLADVAFPALLLHPGHTENLLMGYQIVFTITVFALSLLAFLVCRIGSRSPVQNLGWGVALLVVIAQGGWLGLVFVPPLGLWLSWCVWRTGSLSTTRRFAYAAVLLLVAAYLTGSVWFLVKAHAERLALENSNGPSLATRVTGIAEVIGIGVGPGAGVYNLNVALLGWVLLGIQSAIAATLVAIGWRRPLERVTAWGLLALLVGVWLFAIGVGFSRGSGIASRYSAFTALGIVVPLLAIARYCRDWRCSILTTLIVLGGIFLFIPQNSKHARNQGQTLDRYYRNLVADISTGMPINILASRHVDFWLGTTAGWHELWVRRFPLLKRVPEPRGGEALSVHFSRDGEGNDREGNFARYRVQVNSPRDIAFLHVRFRPETQTPWEPLCFHWIDPFTREAGRSVVFPWLLTQDQEANFWIDGPLTSGDLLLGDQKCRIEILSVEAVLKD